MTGRTPALLAAALVVVVAGAVGEVVVARRRGRGPLLVVPLLLAGTALCSVAGARGPLVVAVPVVVVGAVGLGWSALCRYEYFVLAMVAIRPSLDIAKGSADQSGPLAVAVSLCFAVVSVTWLLLQRPTDAGSRPPFATTAVILGAAGVLSTLGARDVTASLAEAARLCSGLLMFVVLFRCISGPTRAARLVGAVLASSVVPCLVGLNQALSGGGRLDIAGVSRVRGTFTHPNILGLYLAMMLVLGFALLPRVRGGVRLTVFALLALQGIVLLLTYSRSGWMAASAGALVVTWVQNRGAVVALFAAGLAVGILVPSVHSRLGGLGDTERSASGGAGNSLIWRFDYWAEALPLGRANPVSGIGLGMTRQATTEEKVLHNDFLRSYVEMGLLGLAAYVAMLIALVRTARQSLRRAKGSTGWPAGAALGGVGVIVVFIVFSIAGNAISQVVTLWTLAAIVTAGWAATLPDRAPSTTGPVLELA